MSEKFLIASLFLLCTCAAQTPRPLACNTRAFTAAERADWRQRLDRVMSSVTASHELSDGYSFEIDARRTSFADLARWVELERKCCPFFVFETGLRGETGAIWLNLRGRDGVKEFIAADFQRWFDRLRRENSVR